MLFKFFHQFRISYGCHIFTSFVLSIFQIFDLVNISSSPSLMSIPPICGIDERPNVILKVNGVFNCQAGVTKLIPYPLAVGILVSNALCLWLLTITSGDLSPHLAESIKDSRSEEH